MASNPKPPTPLQHSALVLQVLNLFSRAEASESAEQAIQQYADLYAIAEARKKLMVWIQKPPYNCPDFDDALDALKKLEGE